jgi:ABC-type transport system involved in multi-copper enzyme maturation permease subunit
MARQLGVLIADTLREAMAKKVVVALLLNGTLAIAAVFWILRTYSLSGSNSMVTLLAMNDPRYQDQLWVARGVFGVAAMVVFAVSLMLCLITTMGLLTTLFEPARNAWLVSHSLSRTRILAGRYLGCVVLAAGMLLYTFAGAWVVTGLKVHLWHLPFFAGAATALVLYCALLAAMLFMHLLFSSPTLMATAAMAISMINLAASKKTELLGLTGDGVLYRVITAAGQALPRASEAAQLTNEYVQTGTVANWSPLWVSALFGFACLAMGSWRFSKRDL